MPGELYRASAVMTLAVSGVVTLVLVLAAAEAQPPDTTCGTTAASMRSC